MTPPADQDRSDAAGVLTLVLPLNRRRRLRRLMFGVALVASVLALAVLALLGFTGNLGLVYFAAPGFVVVLSVPFTIAWWTRPSRLPAADPVLERGGLRLSADGRRLRRDVVVPWAKVRRLSVSLRTLAIDPLEWADLGGDDPAERARWAKEQQRRRQTDLALLYPLAAGLPGRARLAEIVADLSDGQVRLG